MRLRGAECCRIPCSCLYIYSIEVRRCVVTKGIDESVLKGSTILKEGRIIKLLKEDMWRRRRRGNGGGQMK